MVLGTWPQAVAWAVGVWVAVVVVAVLGTFNVDWTADSSISSFTFTGRVVGVLGEVWLMTFLSPSGRVPDGPSVE